MGDIMYYINCFFMYSVLGFLTESFIYKIMNYSNYSGFLHGPITPIYGMGAITIIFINKRIFNKFKCNKLLVIILQFVVFTILLTILEFIGGFLLKELLNIELWNYTNKEYNIGRYVCLELDIVWGIFSIIFVYIIHPFINKFIKKIPKKGTYLFIILFIIDLIITLCENI